MFSSYGPDVMEHESVGWKFQRDIDDFHDVVYDHLVDASVKAVPEVMNASKLQ